MRRFTPTLALALAFAGALLLQTPARAENVFSVAGIRVDASAASASAAQLAAIAQGRPRAWTTLYRRLARQQDWPRQPQLDDAQLQRIIRGFQVRDERRSTTRYVATLTYEFGPEAVGRVLQSAGIPYAQAQASKRVLVVPFAPNYARGSAWGAALASPRFADSVVPLALPSGSAAESELGGLSFDAATWADVAPVAAHMHATEAVLVLAMPNAGHMTISLRRLGQGQLPSKASVDIPLAQGGAASTYPEAADAAVRAIEDMWKSHAAVDFGQTGHLTAGVRIASLAQWGNLQASLATVPNISGVNVLAMDIGAARVSITYLGTSEQLRDALSAQGIVLTNHGGEWSLSAQGAP